MKLLITGASGFLGRYVGVAALRRGHHVYAVVRPRHDRAPLPWENHSAVTVLEADLAEPGGLSHFPANINGVIHLAASKSSNIEEAYRGTVLTTQHLLQAIETTQNTRLTLVSSFSVYDYAHLQEGDILDESCPTDKQVEQRDAYAQTKLQQEELVREFATHHPDMVTILRPGMIFGREMLWNACHGIRAKRIWLQVGRHETMPLTYVENCAEAVVRAVEAHTARGQTLNIVDDMLPSRQDYTQALLKISDSSFHVIPISWPLLRSAAYFVSSLNQGFTRGQLKLPGLLTPPRLEARFKPLNYSNQRARNCLNWEPRYNWREAIERCSNYQLSLLSVQSP